MAELLFIQPSEIASTTVLGGNVDVDKYLFNVLTTQISVIEPLLGTELYDYIVTNFATLTGDYSTLYTEFVKPITKYEALADYIEQASYTLDNAGLFKHAPDNAEVVDKDEAQYLAQKYHALAQMYVQRFNKWICKNTITEYKTYQDEVNAQKNMKLTGGWYFGKKTGLTEDQLGFTDNTNDYLQLE